MSRFLIQVGPEASQSCSLHVLSPSMQRSVDMADPIKALEYICDEGGRSMVLLGPESVEPSAWIHWLKHGAELGLTRMGLQTAGQNLVDRQYVRRLANHGLTNLDVALFGNQPASHDYHTTIEGSFRATLEGIENAVDEGLEVGITILVTRSNYRELSGLVQRCIAMRVKAIHFEFPQASGRSHAYFLRVVPQFQMLLPHLANAARRARTGGLPVFLSGVPFCVMGSSAAACLEFHHGHRQPENERHGCQSCPLEDVCPGLNSQYKKRFGSHELRCESIDPDLLKARAHHLEDLAEIFVALGEAESVLHG